MSSLRDSALNYGPMFDCDPETFERRKEPRLSVDLFVEVTVLGMSGERIMTGRVLDIARSGIRLGLPLPMARGAAVKIEGNNMLMLGEACYSQPVEGGYVVGVNLSHSLGALSQLDRLNRAFLAEEPRREVSNLVLRG